MTIATGAASMSSVALALAIHGDLGLTGASTVESAPDLGR